MQMLNFVVTLTTSAQALAYGSGKDYSCRQILLQPDAANANPMYVGGEGVTTSTGLRLEGYDADSRPPAPFPILFARDNPGALSMVYVLGTAGEKVRVTVITA